MATVVQMQFGITEGNESVTSYVNRSVTSFNPIGRAQVKATLALTATVPRGALVAQKAETIGMHPVAI